MKSIDERLSRLEGLIQKELTGVCTFTDGTTRRLDVLDVVLYALSDDEPKIASVKWLGDTNGAGVLPAIAEWLMEGAAKERDISDFE